MIYSGLKFIVVERIVGQAQEIWFLGFSAFVNLGKLIDCSMAQFLYLNTEEVVQHMALESSMSSISNCEYNEHLIFLKIVVFCPLASLEYHLSSTTTPSPILTLLFQVKIYSIEMDRNYYALENYACHKIDYLISSRMAMHITHIKLAS